MRHPRKCADTYRHHKYTDTKPWPTTRQHEPTKFGLAPCRTDESLILISCGCVAEFRQADTLITKIWGILHVIRGTAWASPMTTARTAGSWQMLDALSRTVESTSRHPMVTSRSGSQERVSSKAYTRKTTSIYGRSCAIVLPFVVNVRFSIR